MNMKPMVSIIIPVYNGSNYLKEAIDSALSQTYPVFEVIVVNDGSGDNGKTKIIAESYGSKIIYKEKSNGGVATALNHGIAAMKGELFSWLSHDDVYYPWKLEKQVDYYLSLNNRKFILFSNEDIIDDRGQIISKAQGFSFHEEKLYMTLMYSRFIGGCSLLIPKRAFDDTGLFNPKYETVQDYDLWFRMINKGYSFKYFPVTTGMSRRHGEQDSVTKRQLCLQEKEEYYIHLQGWFDRKYWIGIWDDEIKGYYHLAKMFYRDGMKKVALFDLKQARTLSVKKALKYRLQNEAGYFCAALWASIRNSYHSSGRRIKRKILFIMPMAK